MVQVLNWPFYIWYRFCIDLFSYGTSLKLIFLHVIQVLYWSFQLLVDLFEDWDPDYWLSDRFEGWDPDYWLLDLFEDWDPDYWLFDLFEDWDPDYWLFHRFEDWDPDYWLFDLFEDWDPDYWLFDLFEDWPFYIWYRFCIDLFSYCTSLKLILLHMIQVLYWSFQLWYKS